MVEMFDAAGAIGVLAQWRMGDVRLAHAKRVKVGPTALDEAVDYLRAWRAGRKWLT